MNFAEIAKLHAQRGNDRQAIANALGLTPQQIDELQLQALRLASELLEADNAASVDRAGHENLAR